MKRFASALLALALCAGAAQASDDNRIVRLATTTSTDNSGLLDFILPMFERDLDYRVQVISVGTGKALRLGESGDVDALLVHAPRSEARFIEAGHGVQRKAIMVNDFLIVGPADDPAGVRDSESGVDAFQRLHRGAHAFISRGDESGTHKKELELWAAASVTASAPWHLQVGQGMGKTLQIADELQAYTLIDRGTWLHLRAKTALVALYDDGDPSLRNPYSAMAVNPQRHAINIEGAMALIDWLTSPAGQDAIGAYTVDGERLFTPNATTTESN